MSFLSGLLSLDSRADAPQGFDTEASERGLVVISNLASLREGARWAAYRLEEREAVRVTRRILAPFYGAQIILEPEEATRENFIGALTELEARREIRVVDVVIYLHGLPGRICFKGEKGAGGDRPCSPVSDLVEELHLTKLRMLYSDACYGATHLERWLAAGFQSVSGSVLQDTNKTWDMRAFMKSWVRGKSYEESIARANRVWITPWMDRIVGGKSLKLIQGDRSLTIHSHFAAQLYNTESRR